MLFFVLRRKFST